LVKIDCAAPDMVMISVDWINGIIFETNVKGKVLGRFDTALCGQSVDATTWWERIDRSRHELAADGEGATYTRADD